jgi:hypothetical protein
MQLLSTPGASFSFDETLPPAPPPILSSLQDPELRIHFERFAAFLYQHKLTGREGLPDALSGAIFDYCVSHLVQMSGTAPVMVAGNCVLRPPLPSTESLTALIVRRFEELRGVSPVTANQFQLYLYLAINYFFVWHCAENYCVSNSSITLPKVNVYCHQFLQQIRDYVADYVKYCWSGLQPPATNTWFSETWFMRACMIECTASMILSDIRSTFSNSKYSWSSQADKVVAARAMAETLRRANLRFLDSETRAIVGRLVGQPSGAGTALVDGYQDFAMYGLGNGSGTTGLFGRENYGIGFFNYAYQFTGEPGQPNGTEILATRSVTLPMCKSDNDGIAFFYFGLETPKPGEPLLPGQTLPEPSISLTLLDTHGATLVTPAPLLCTQGPADYRFSGVPGSRVTPASLGTETVDSVEMVIRSDPPDNPEEVVFIIFKNRIGEPAAVSIEAEWRFNDNRFAGADALSGPVFSGQTLQDKLKTIVGDLVATANVDIQTFIQGYCVGESLNRAANAPGCDLRRAPIQTDTHHGGPSYAALRYCHGRIFWSPSTQLLWFTAEGFVSPLRCTWDSHLVPTGNLTLQGTFGQFLLPTAQPSYNCVLSAFRAFSICEAMMQAVMDRAVEMAFDGDITVAQANTLIASLTAHLTQAAIGHIQTPNGRPLMRRNPEQEILVTHSIFHGFTVQ